MTGKMLNRERVLARLARIPAALKVAVREQLDAEAAELVEAMKRAAPHDTGAYRDSIRLEPGDHELAVRIVAGGPTTTKKVRKGVKDADFAEALLSGGNKGEFDYARALEFGYRDESGDHHPGQPSFFPTYRARKRAMRRRIKAAGRKAIKQQFPG